MTPLWLKRDYRAVTLALLSCVAGLILMRIVVYFCAFPSDTYGQSLASDAFFALITQIVFFLGVPFAIYKFYGKRTVRETLEFSSVGGFKPYYLLALPLGAAVFFVTVGVSSLWTSLLRLTGYTVPSNPDLMPNEFVFGYFVADVLLTAVLPAVCEEFAMRGGLLSTVKKSFGTVACVLICGAAFGLFHQNIRQVFYTSLFGMLAAFLTIRLKSIFPAMLMHFGNNFCSVYIDYATEYDWAVGGGFYDISSAGGRTVFAVAALAAAAIAAVLVIAMIYIRDKKVIAKKRDVLKDSAFDAGNKRVVLMGEFDPQKVEELEMEKEVYGGDYKRELYKPSLRELAGIIALAVVTLCTTVFTYVWGFLY